MSGPANRLQVEIRNLQATIASTAKNPFLPQAARDAIGQAGAVIVTLATELEQLRALFMSAGDSVNAELRAMRRQLATNHPEVGHLGLDL